VNLPRLGTGRAEWQSRRTIVLHFKESPDILALDKVIRALEMSPYVRGVSYDGLVSDGTTRVDIQFRSSANSEKIERLIAQLDLDYPHHGIVTAYIFRNNEGRHVGTCLNVRFPYQHLDDSTIAKLAGASVQRYEKEETRHDGTTKTTLRISLKWPLREAREIADECRRIGKVTGIYMENVEEEGGKLVVDDPSLYRLFTNFDAVK
jgi:hypothetical protein